MFGKDKGKKAINKQSYVVHQQKDDSRDSKEPLTSRFTLQKASGEKIPQEFENFQQVLTFLLDELLEDD